MSPELLEFFSYDSKTYNNKVDIWLVLEFILKQGERV
jgi:hypothetical protein